MEVLLDRGADLETKDEVSAAAVCVAARRPTKGVTNGWERAAVAVTRQGVVLLSRAGL